MRIDQLTFKGMVPVMAPHLLPENKAQLAVNTDLFSGNLNAFKSTILDYTAQPSSMTIYQYRDGGNTYWFEWSTDVDVVESPVAGDLNNRIYMTGTVDGARYTDNALSLSSSPYPAADKQLGMPQPTDTPVLVAGTEPPDPDPFSAETRSYVYTFVESDGSESAPSPLSTIDNIYPGQTVSVTIVNNPGIVDLNILYARIYRTTPAGLWQYVDQINVGITNYIDSVATENLGEILVTTDWVAPPNDIKGLIGLDQGSMAAFVDNELLFSEPYIPYAWPIKYRLSLMFNIVALSSSSQNIYIATEGRPYIAFGTNPGEYQLVKIDEDLPCVSKRSMVDAGEYAFYASTDGIVMFQGQTAKLVTSEIIEADDWYDNYDPTNLNCVWHDNKIFCFSPNIGFIFNPNSNDIVHIELPSGYVVDAYQSLKEDTLYILTSENQILKWDKGVGKMTYQYHGRDSVYSPTWFAAAQVNAETYDDLTFELYRDKTLVHTKVVTDNIPFRLPTKRGRKYSYMLRGSDEVRGVFLASTMSELNGV